MTRTHFFSSVVQIKALIARQCSCRHLDSWLSSCRAFSKCMMIVVGSVGRFFLLPQAGLFKPANQSKQSFVRLMQTCHILTHRHSVSLHPENRVLYNIQICRIWRPVLIKIRQGCHFCFPFVWNFLINCLRMWERRRTDRGAAEDPLRKRFSHLKAARFQMFKNLKASCRILNWFSTAKCQITWKVNPN